MATSSFNRFLSVAGLAALAALLSPAASAQLSWGGEPVSQHAKLRTVAPTAVMAPVNVAEYLAEDMVAGKGTPFRYGATLPVDLGLDNAGAWETLPNGDRVWRLRISSPGAYSLSAVFGAYDLPGGSSLFVYDDARTGVLGGYDDRNNQENGEFAFQPLAGSAMTLEYYEPAPVKGQGKLRVQSVIHDYRDIITIMDKDGGPGDAAGACEVDVNCPQGAPWQVHKRAVTLILAGGSACTGALINNTANDGTQYYMSAFHCGTLTNAVFRFNFEKPQCGSGVAPTNHTVSGSTQMAGNQSLDFRLVKINSPIPTSYQPFYLGWDHSTTAIPTNTITIHHPEIDVKKISFDNDPPSKSGSQWKIAQWDLGVTEPGSSGCPLMNQAGRFIGQLFGGQATCSFVFNDFYGRFDLAWPSVSTFLDPAATGAIAIDGFDPSAPSNPPVLSSVSPPTVQALLGGTVTLTGSGFATATKVTTGGVQLVSPGLDFTIVNDTSITYTAPTATSLGSTAVTVTNNAGTSGAKNFTYVECNPPKLSASGLAFNGQPYTWTWGAGSSDVAYLVYALNNSTFNFQGFPILVNFNIVVSGPLPPVGITSLQINIPVGLSGIFFYSQAISFDNVTSNFVGASGVVPTLIL